MRASVSVFTIDGHFSAQTYPVSHLLSSASKTDNRVQKQRLLLKSCIELGATAGQRASRSIV